ncbi:hypothetical protein [Streptomyces parvulus]|uniref:hypothetical protein n=1 Tax=Streptomyces parvulus TaxID=146923 RepID=UPI0037FC4123
MSRDPLSWRVLAGGAAAAVFLGALVAACQHQDDPVPASDCDGVTYVMPAAAVEGTKSSSKNLDRPRSRASKAPRQKASKTPARPSPSPSRHGHGPRIDLDLDGC